MDIYKQKLRSKVGERISKHIGECLKISYTECANRINTYCMENEIDYSITGPAIHQYIGEGTEQRRPPIEFITIFAKTFNVSTDWLLGLSPIPSTDEDVTATARFLGIKQEDTVTAIKKIFTNPSYKPNPAMSGLEYKDMQPLMEAIIQSDHFYNMFVDGYTEFIDYLVMEKLGVEKRMTGANLFKLLSLDDESRLYFAFSKITLNAYKAAEDIEKEIGEYVETHPTLIALNRQIEESNNHEDE